MGIDKTLAAGAIAMTLSAAGVALEVTGNKAEAPVAAAAGLGMMAAAYVSSKEENKEIEDRINDLENRRNR